MLKRILLLVITACIVGVMVSGCAPDSENVTTYVTTNLGTITTSNVLLKYASGFTIEEMSNGHKKITDSENQIYILVPEDNNEPVSFPEGENDPASYTIIKTPMTRVVILSITFGALMRPLGVLDSVVGCGTIQNELYIEELVDGYSNGNITYVGGGGMAAPDYEQIQALNPDIVFMSINVSSPDTFEYYEQLKTLGIPVVVCNDYLENNPLGRLEWIKLFAAFYDMDEKAAQYFDSVEKKINDIKVQVMLSFRCPVVLWSSIFMGDCWVSGGESYVAKMIAMLNGSYVFSDLKGSEASSISLEELYARGQSCDVFIYASTPPWINSIKEIVDGAPILADLPSIKSGEVYCFPPDYYQISDKPDEILQDLAFIFHPERFPDYQLKHFIKLPVEKK
jgi:iron complex transport system substrate-binding protein